MLPILPRMPGTIMIVEDEPAVARGVQVALEREGYAVTVQPTGEDAVANFADAAPDLVVLDVRLPGIDGFEVLRRLRRETRAPVIFLTARADEVDKVVGLEMGADDYLVKPFSVRELVSRIKALLRRAYGELADTQTGRTLRRGDLVIDLERRRVTRDGERIGLTTTEFDLLRHLAARPGRVYTRSSFWSWCATTTTRSSRTSGRSTSTSATSATRSSPIPPSPATSGR